MKILRMVSVPEIVIQFTAADIRALREAACQHYDPHCRELAESGTIKNLTIRSEMHGELVPIDLCFTFTDLDLLCKVAESALVDTAMRRILFEAIYKMKPFYGKEIPLE